MKFDFDWVIYNEYLVLTACFNEPRVCFDDGRDNYDFEPVHFISLCNFVASRVLWEFYWIEFGGIRSFFENETYHVRVLYACLPVRGLCAVG